MQSSANMRRERYAIFKRRIAISCSDSSTHLNEGVEGAGADAEEALTQTEVEREFFAPTDGTMRGRDDPDRALETPRQIGEEGATRGSPMTCALLREANALPLVVRCWIIISSLSELIRKRSDGDRRSAREIFWGPTFPRRGNPSRALSLFTSNKIIAARHIVYFSGSQTHRRLTYPVSKRFLA